MDIKAYIYHKKAEKYCDCQDCYGIDSHNNRIAISDGMSQSIYPRWWAEILVDAYLKTGRIPQDISNLQQHWLELVLQEISQRENIGHNPWRLKNSIAEKSGAGATLCGFSWDKDGWSCECLGDSCLIVIDRNYGIRFHTSQNGEFGNHPDYFDSFTTGKGCICKADGQYDEVIALLLVTDPFSELFYKHRMDASFIRDCLLELNELTDHQSFIALVERWRDDFNMHNDDSSLIILQAFESPNLNVIHEDNWKDLCENEETEELAKHKEKQEQEIIEVNTKLECAVKHWLHFYNGKMKSGKIKDALFKKVSPIIRDFLNK